MKKRAAANSKVRKKRKAQAGPAVSSKKLATEESAFQSIGELYGMIERGIMEVPDAIIGDPAAQVGPDLIDFPDIVGVVDLDSARDAIDLVTHQGEGNQTDRADCHFGIFLKLLEALDQEKRKNPAFSPAYPAMINPSTDTSEDYGAPRATLIRNQYARDVAQLFDGLYSLMLRMLGYTFTPSADPGLRRVLAQRAIVMMVTVIKPLGEALPLIPAKGDSEGLRAGPPFGLTRHVILPSDPATARVLVSERLAELTDTTAHLASLPQAPALLGRVEATLRRLSSQGEPALPGLAARSPEVAPA